MSDEIRDQLAHEQRVRELLSMRELDGNFELQIAQTEEDEEGKIIVTDYKLVTVPNRYEIKDLLLELNIRMSQYLGQFHFSIEYFINQCLQDFKNEKNIIVLHKDGKPDYSKPVALIDRQAIYVNPVLQRDEISLSSPVFIREKVIE